LLSGSRMQLPVVPLPLKEEIRLKYHWFLLNANVNLLMNYICVFHKVRAFHRTYVSLHLLLHSSVLQWFPMEQTPQKCPFKCGVWAPSNTWFPWPNPSPHPKWPLTRLTRFCTAHGRHVPILYNRSPLFRQKIAHSLRGSAPLLIWFLWPTWLSPPPKRDLDWFGHFCKYHKCDQQTDRDWPCYPMYGNRPLSLQSSLIIVRKIII